jgi:hypothetical protein
LRTDALVDDLLVHEGDRAFGTLGDVIEHLAVQGATAEGVAPHAMSVIVGFASFLPRERRGIVIPGPV